MPGDGIGRVVMDEAIRVLNAAGFDAEYVHGDIGWEFWCNEGNALPERTIELLKKHRVGLFGAITSKAKGRSRCRIIPGIKRQRFCLCQSHREHAPDVQPGYLYQAMPHIQG